MPQPFKSLMLEATSLTRSGLLGEATRLIQRALGRGTSATEVQNPASAPSEGLLGRRFSLPPTEERVINDHRVGLEDEEIVGEGEFIQGTFALGTQQRHYKLFVPPGHQGKKLPLVVMLHGCTQDPDDFAAGTGMNELALEQRFFVLYPAQSRSANSSRCWNWFKPADQQRDSGEPALIAAMVRSVLEQFGADDARTYIAGLSAGGAMAAVIANAYPELFAAVGVHSGLPCGSARNVMEALSVMKSGDAGSRFPFEPGRPGVAAKNRNAPPVPTIVFHGDRDHMVHPDNGAQVVKEALGVLARDTTTQGLVETAQEIKADAAGNSRSCSRTVYADASGSPLVEQWIIHGAGHAWSGGRPAGSYTDPRGPDASAEMLRFFLQHSLRDSMANQ